MAMSHAVYLTVASDEVYLAPGGRRDVMLTVQNTGSSVEHYRLDVSGIPAECYDLDQPHLTLPASASAHVHLAVHLPADATSASGRYPVTVQVTSEDDPTHRASAAFVLIVDSGSGLDMDVRPAEATGRDATFQIAFLNQGPAPAVVALAARDSDDALCVHIAPPDPVVVPPGATAALATVHVRPKRRRTGDRPQRYAIEFRARPVGSGPLSTPALVAHARFTYVPRPALLRRPGWLRRLPVWTLALMLTLLLVLVLLLQAYLATQPTATPQTLLCPGTIVFQLRNDGAHPVTITQVSINDAFWPFTARPSTTITPHGTAFVTLRYPWVAGVAYEVRSISSTGATFVTDIDATTTASAPACP
jgi:hypothetical protein